MKDKFPGYFAFSSKEIRELWRNSLFVFDANVLLGLYRYSDETRRQFIDVLKYVQDRCWLPYQAAQEFLDNRLEVIGQQQEAYEEAVKGINDLEGRFRHSHQHPFISHKLLDRLGKDFEEARNELTANAGTHNKRIHQDEILVEIGNIFEGRVGEKFSEEELQVIYTEGQSRYDNKIPPGYKDSKKPDEGNRARKYGDLIIWKEVLQKAEGLNKGIILISNDKKEDWWTQFKGKTIIPRPELAREFKDHSTEKFHMYQSDRFLKFAGEFLGRTVSEPAVSEIREIQRIDEEKLLQRREQKMRANRIRRDLRIAEQSIREKRELEEVLQSRRADLYNQKDELSKILAGADPTNLSSSDYKVLEEIDNKLRDLNSELVYLRKALNEDTHRYNYISNNMKLNME